MKKQQFELLFRPTLGLQPITLILTGLFLAVGFKERIAMPAFAMSAANIIKEDVTFNPPRGGAPSQTRGGASRGDIACSRDATSRQEQQFVALTPTSNYGLTLADRPTFLAYIPPTTAHEAFFVLKGEDGQVYYQNTLPIPSEGGVMRLPLPEAAPSLEVGKSYQWGMAILCSGRLRPDSPFISSWIQRTALDAALVNRLNTVSPIERAALYGANGIWYDALATLADLRMQQPENTTFSSTWETLLNSVELNRVATAPLLN